MPQLDFSKKIVCSDSAYTVVRVIHVKFSSPDFTYALIVENDNGFQNIVPTNVFGSPDRTSQFYRKVTFKNPEPEIASKYYSAVYSNATGILYGEIQEVKFAAHDDVKFILEILTYDNGEVKANLIPFTKE